jgi:hypothetical protein
MFATTSFGELVLFWLIVLPLAFHGFRKFGKWIDPKGEIKEAGKNGILGKIGDLFKK